ncbi:MAG: hypothetical protein Kow0031_00180 [Anaerolineae bacterium]
MPGNLPHKITITAGAALLLTLFALAGQSARAFTHHLDDVHNRYPDITGSRIDRCDLCHQTDPASYPARNAFGQAFEAAGFNLAAIEALDSDGDGFTNAEELNAHAYPGDFTDRPVIAKNFTNWIYLPVLMKSPPPTSNGQYVILGWNDLGMHCMDPSYEDFAVLPPYNTLWAQVIRRGEEPDIVTGGVSVEYRILNNSYSAGKTNFWDYAHVLFNLPQPLLPNVGLAGMGLNGQMHSSGDHFVAEGIPLTEYRDSDLTTPYPYQVAELVARDSSGNVLASTKTVAPVSTEMNCQNCHADNGTANPALATGVVKQNILTLHDQQEGTSLMANRPVLCASCHGSNALKLSGNPALPNLSQAMHGKHQAMDDFTMEGTCYQCHPGPQTKCLRGTMAQDGMTCQDCHGDMADVADPARNPWLDEPRCGDCHGAAHAEDPGQLYRFSTGHGGVYCQACHGSQHAIYPTVEHNDNMQSIMLQGRAGTIDQCTVCHTRVPDENEGPHRGDDDD